MIVRTRAETTLGVIWGLMVRLALIAAVAYFLYRVRSVFIAVILAITLAYAVLPAVEMLCRRRVRGISAHTQRLLATILVFVILIVAVGVTIRLFVVPFQRELTNLYDNLDTMILQVKDLAKKTSSWYATLPPDVQGFIKSQEFGKLTPSVGDFTKKLMNSTLAWLTHIVDIVLIPVLAFYFVLDSRSLRREFLALVPKKRVREALFILRDVGAIMQSYIIGQFILCLIAAVLTGAVLYALDMDYALVLAVFSGVTRAIPVIGPVVSGIPIATLGALRDINTGLFLLGFVIFMHFAESKFIMPKLIGHRMKLHPAVVLIVLLIGAEFFGILGMFLAAPVAAIIRELIRFYILRPRVAGIRRQPGDENELTASYLRSGRL